MSKRGPKAFSEDFRREAVRLAETRPATQVARELGIHVETLRSWRRRAAHETRGTVLGESTAGTRAEMEAELRRLQRENARLREEREILKKATAFFAKENR